MVIIGQAGQRSRESNLNKPLLAGKIKNTPSTCKENELPALIPRDAALQLYIHLPLGPWPRLCCEAQHKVNEAENTSRAAGCQAWSKGGCQPASPPPQRQRVRGQ